MKKVVKRMLPVCLTLSVLLSIWSMAGLTVSADTATLNVYNWGVYMDDGQGEGSFSDEKSQMDVNAAFEEHYKETYGEEIKVNYTTYENNESMYAKLKAGGANYDIVIPSDYMINRMIHEDMLEKLDFSNIPNYTNIGEQFKNGSWNYDPASEYSVPYMWGTVGIVYNSDVVTGTVNTWDVLWNEKYSGKILMMNNPRDSFAIALAKNGKSLNSTNLADWDEAYASLEEQKPLVQAYVTDESFEKMQSGEAAIAPCYYGDYLIMKANASEGVNLRFAQITQQAANKYVDAICIPKGAQNKTAAERYINFLCSYEVSLANANYTGYSSPNTLVQNNDNSSGLYYNYAGDPVVYPSESTLASFEEFLWLGDAVQGKMDSLWSDLKKSEISPLLYVALAAVVVLVIVIIILRRVKIKKAEQYSKNKSRG